MVESSSASLLRVLGVPWPSASSSDGMLFEPLSIAPDVLQDTVSREKAVGE